MSAAASDGKLAFHAVSHPGSLGLFAFFPAPAAIMLWLYAATNFRILPTVTSYLSKRKSLTVAG
jgi:hypothetical protein